MVSYIQFNLELQVCISQKHSRVQYASIELGRTKCQSTIFKGKSATCRFQHVTKVSDAAPVPTSERCEGRRFQTLFDDLKNCLFEAY